MTPPRIVRRTGVVTQSHYDQYGDSGVEAIAAEVEHQADELAARIGITRPSIRRAWTLDVGPLEYPMYLLGPGAPQVRTCRDVICHGYNALYIVEIRDQDELDADDVRFYEERADQLARDGEALFLEQWAPNVLEKARLVLDKRG